MRDLVRDDLYNHAPYMIDAYDIWKAFERAQKHGLTVEWFDTFIGFIKYDVALGKIDIDYVKNAEDACREWDV